MSATDPCAFCGVIGCECQFRGAEKVCLTPDSYLRLLDARRIAWVFSVGKSLNICRFGIHKVVASCRADDGTSRQVMEPGEWVFDTNRRLFVLNPCEVDGAFVPPSLTPEVRERIDKEILWVEEVDSENNDTVAENLSLKVDKDK